MRQGDDLFWLGKGTLKTALARRRSRSSRSGPGAELVGWRYARPVRRAAGRPGGLRRGTRDDADVPYEHRVVAWDEVGEDEGTGIVHIAPGCGAEDFQLGKALGLPVVAPLDESGPLPRRASAG